MTLRPPAAVLTATALATLLAACDRADTRVVDDAATDMPKPVAAGAADGPTVKTATDASAVEARGVPTDAPSGVTVARERSVVAAAARDGDEPGTWSMTVHKSPTCGCCAAWIDYMEEEGFATTTIETDDVDAVKHAHGLTDPGLKSCHTALVGGYVIEGHVPADDVRRLLAEKPDVVGLSAPGMPALSPGMGSREPRDYDVVAFERDGDVRVWSSY